MCLEVTSEAIDHRIAALNYKRGKGCDVCVTPDNPRADNELVTCGLWAIAGGFCLCLCDYCIYWITLFYIVCSSMMGCVYTARVWNIYYLVMRVSDGKPQRLLDVCSYMSTTFCSFLRHHTIDDTLPWSWLFAHLMTNVMTCAHKSNSVDHP